MAVTASQFQVVLSVVKKWYFKGLCERRVNGQLALCDIYDDEDKRIFCYAPADVVMGFVFSYSARLEWQGRGTQHIHGMIWLN